MESHYSSIFDFHLFLLLVTGLYTSRANPIFSFNIFEVNLKWFFSLFEKAGLFILKSGWPFWNCYWLQHSLFVHFAVLASLILNSSS